MRLCLFVVSVKSMALVNRDFCMSDPFPCQPSDISKAIGTFPGVHSQSGCAERCQQYEKCYKWTWYHETNTCLIFEENSCQNLAKNETFCGCFTAPKCQNWDSETTPTLVGGVETVVEVLLKRGPDSGIVSDLPEDRQFPVVASIEDKLFLCGGTNNSGFAKSSCFYYSFVSQKWIELEESLPGGPLSRSAGVAAYGDFYILGGQTSTGEATDKVEILDGDHRKWFIGQPMPKKLAGHCAIRDWDTIYVIGSPAAPSTKSVGTLEVFLFNITTSIWHTLPSSIIGNGNGPVAQRDFACSLSPDRSQIFVSGGKMDSGRSVNDFFAFYLRSETWWQLASSLEPRSGHVMTSYQNYTTIIGGVNADNESLGSMESFVEGSWKRLNETLTKRKNFRVTQVPSNFFPQN